MSKSREKLAAYLFSDEYFFLLERAVLARIATTTSNFGKHAHAIQLIKDFKADPDNRLNYKEV